MVWEVSGSRGIARVGWDGIVWDRHGVRRGRVGSNDQRLMFCGVGGLFFVSLLAFVLCPLFLVSSSRLCLATSYRWCFFVAFFFLLLMTWESGLGWTSWRCDIGGIWWRWSKVRCLFFSALAAVLLLIGGEQTDAPARSLPFYFYHFRFLLVG